MKILESKIHHVGEYCVRAILDLERLKLDPGRVSIMVNIPLATVETIKWINDSTYTPETKKLILSRIYYLDKTEENNFSVIKSRIAMCDAQDHYETTQLLLHKVLKDAPYTTVSMLQAIVSANMRTSMAAQPIIKLTEDFKIKMTYNLKCSQALKSRDFDYENYKDDVLRKLGPSAINPDNTILVNIIKIKVISRFYITNDIEKYDDCCEEKVRNFRYGFHNFFVLISLTRNKINNVQIRTGCGYNSDDVVEVLNELFKKYETTKDQMLFVMGPGIPWEKEHISAMTRIFVNNEEPVDFFSQAGVFCASFQELIRTKKFEEISGNEATSQYMYPLKRLMDDFEVYIQDCPVIGPEEVNRYIIEKFKNFTESVSTEELYSPK